MEKDKAISQDDEKRAENQLQKMTDIYIAEIEKIGAAKEKELLAV